MFNIEKEEVVYKRYLTLYSRSVRFPESDASPQADGAVHEYDVVGHPRCDFRFTVVFPFHKGTAGGPGHVTLLREYCQGTNEMGYVLPTGGFDPIKHEDTEACARAELSEEAHLAGGELVRLLPDDHPGIAEVKWCRNRFVPFLAIDPAVDGSPGARDKEEYIQVLQVTVPELRRILVSGEMMLPSITTSFLALEALEERGLL